MYKNNRVLVIVPAYNEEESIKITCDRLKKYPEYDFVVIDDGSTDKTKLICKEEGYNYISLSMNLGIGGAVQTGYKYAYKFNYDFALQFDGDGFHLSCLATLLHLSSEIIWLSLFLFAKGGGGGGGGVSFPFLSFSSLFILSLFLPLLLISFLPFLFPFHGFFFV